MKTICTCGQPIEYMAEQAGYTINCPSCGYGLTLPVLRQSPPPLPKKPAPKPKSIAFILTVTFGSIFLGVITLMVLFPGPPNNPKLPPARVFGGRGPQVDRTIRASIQTSTTEIRITNLTSNQWTGVDIYLNGMPPFSKRYQGVSIEPGNTRTLDLNSFADRNGKRFNPYAEKVVEVWIGGGAEHYDYTSFGSR